MTSTMTSVATTTRHGPIRSPAAILSEAQIEELLQQVEAKRLPKDNQDFESNGNIVSLGADDVPKKSKSVLPKLEHGLTKQAYLSSQNGITKVDRSALISENERKMATELRALPATKDDKKVNDQTNSGPDWFDLPKTEVTPQLKRDLQLISMRNVLDPHRHYKKDNRKNKIPSFSQTGTIVEGPTDFFSGRINRKDRAKNFVEEAMRGEMQDGRFKRKYGEIQEKKTSGKKAHYQKVLAKRKRKA